MDTNFLNIRIISYRDTVTFRFVPLVLQVAQVAESRKTTYGLLEITSNIFVLSFI